MNATVIKNAMGGLEKLLANARDALVDVGREYYVGTEEGTFGGYAEPREALAGFLEHLFDVLLIVLEAAELPGVRSNLIARWKEFRSGKNGLRHAYFDDDYGATYSPAFSYTERLIGGLRMAVSEEMTTEQAWELSRLEAILRETHGLVHRRGIPPANEHDLQTIMHDYLDAFFAGFVRNPTINGTIKNFVPDCGIPRLSAAIEFKIAHTEKDVKVAFSGITEDTAGYKDHRWKRFYAVIYQAKPFVLNTHIQSDMERIGALTWKVFLVNGETKPRREKKSAAKRPAAKKSVSEETPHPPTQS